MLSHKWKIALLGILLLPTATANGQGKNDTELERQRAIYKKYSPDNFDDGGEISHYVWKNFPAFFLHDTIARTNPARPLLEAPSRELANLSVEAEGEDRSLESYVTNSPQVDGMIVMSRGQIVFEAYPRMQGHDRHLGWSVTKVVVGAALAALEHQGKVDMAQPVETYVPDLKRTAWEGISVRNIVNMASGIKCLDSEGYQNTNGCIYRYEESLGLTAQHNDPMETLDVLRSMERHRAAGTKYEYVSADTFVIGMVVENISGQPLALALQSLVWDKIGAEADGMMMVSPDGRAAAHAGLSARLRDIARFGQLYTGDGMGAFDAAHQADLRSRNGIRFSPQQLFQLKERYGDDAPTHAAWQWDMIWADGAMFKGGYSGQGLYIDPDKELVVAFFGTANERGRSNDLLWVSRQLSNSGLFD